MSRRPRPPDKLGAGAGEKLSWAASAAQCRGRGKRRPYDNELRSGINYLCNLWINKTLINYANGSVSTIVSSRPGPTDINRIGRFKYISM